MTPADIDRVFGRGRLRMVTGDHVEVFREAAQPGERRRYTKRFLATPPATSAQWTEREWRILARLVGHGIGRVPDVVQFDRGAADRPALVQTYDAGVTVDHWATLLPLERDGARPAQRVRGLRALVGAGAPLPGRARRDPRAAPGPPRPQGRQRLHPGRPGDFDPHARGQRAAAALRRHRADRLRVLARLRRAARRARCRSPGRPTTTTSRRACCRRSRPAAAATCADARSSTGAATCSAWRRCCGATCPSSRHATAGGLDAAAPRQGARARAPPARGARRRAAGRAPARRADRARRASRCATPSWPIRCSAAGRWRSTQPRRAATRRRR